MLSKCTRWVCDEDVCEKGGRPFQVGLSLVGHACMSTEIRCKESPESAVPVKSHLTERSSVNRSSEWEFCLILWVCLCARIDVCQPDMCFWPGQSGGRKKFWKSGLRSHTKRWNIPLIVLGARKAEPDAAQPKQLERTGHEVGVRKICPRSLSGGIG